MFYLYVLMRVLIILCMRFLLTPYYSTILFTQSVNTMRLMTVCECRIQGERRPPTAARRLQDATPTADHRSATDARRLQEAAQRCTAFRKSHVDKQHHGQCAPHERADGNTTTFGDGHHGSADILATHVWQTTSWER
jgi:hypothetical protein